MLLINYTGIVVIGLKCQYHKITHFCRHILAFTVEKILEQELHEFQHFWNTHHIQKNRQSASPHGIPNDLYEMPELFGTKLSIIAYFFQKGSSNHKSNWTMSCGNMQCLMNPSMYQN